MTLPAADERSFLEVQVAVGTVTSFQSATQHADSKAGMLAAAGAALAAFVTGHAADRLPPLLAGPHPDWRARAAVAILAAFTAAAVATGVALLQAIRPRIAPPPDEVNRFAFPTVAHRLATGHPIARADPDELCAEAWSMAARMAAIALAKHRHIRFAVYGTAAMVVMTLPAIWLLPG
jgi:HEAT repeat protein